MDTTTLNEEVKTRVPAEQKHELKIIADSRHLKVSDIFREALREFIARPEQQEILKARNNLHTAH